jgi:hypothetical protein
MSSFELFALLLHKVERMKKVWIVLVFFLSLTLFSKELQAQCSICTKTAQQLGEKTGKGLNAGILYLAAAPLMIVGFIGYRWWKSNQES